MAAVKRVGVKWDDEYMISQAEVQAGDYDREYGEDGISGKEFCTVDGVRYWRADCYADFSPYGWYLVGEGEDGEGEDDEGDEEDEEEDLFDVEPTTEELAEKQRQNPDAPPARWRFPV